MRPPDMFKWAIAIRDNGQQTLAIFAGRKDTDGLSHAHGLAHPPEFMNYPSVSVQMLAEEILRKALDPVA